MASTLSPEELRRMMDNSIKLMTEGKITKDNSWDLSLNNHWGSIIRMETQAEEFNFHRMSSGLEAGTRIWEQRVESTYQMASQVLHGLGAGPSAARQDGDDDGGEGADGPGAAPGAAAAAGPAAGRKARGGAGGSDPSSTLSHPDALRAKKGGLTFENDPLFRRTTKLFDENSASGLLLLNYPVLDGCHILFDGAEKLPLQCSTNKPAANHAHATIDLGPLSALAQQVANMPRKPMTPALRQLLDQVQGRQAAASLQLDNTAILRACAPKTQGRAAAPSAAAHDSPAQADQADAADGASPVSPGPHAEPHEPHGDPAADDGHMDHMGVEEEEPEPAWLQGDVDLGQDDDALDAGPLDQERRAGPSGWADTLDDNQGADSDFEGGSMGDAGFSQGSVSVMDSLGLPGGQSSGAVPGGSEAQWAGQAFWSYKAKAAPAARKPATKPRAPPKQRGELNLLGPRFDPSTIELSTHKATSKITRKQPVTLLPQDAQYKGTSLYHLSISPSLHVQDLWRLEEEYARAKATAAAATRRRGQSQQQGHSEFTAEDGDSGGAWDADDGAGGGEGDDGYDDGGGGGGGEGGEQGWLAAMAAGGGALRPEGDQAHDPLSLEGLLAAPRKAPVLQADFTAKQVDVKALKECIKGQLTRHQRSQQQQTFSKVVEDLPLAELGPAARDVSVHLAFICLLHLANEHGLALKNNGHLDRLDIDAPNGLV